MPKNIIVCYDGTGNEYGGNHTNVVKTFESILRREEQVGFYDPGVGTFSYFGRTLGKKIGILLGKAFGAGLQENIEDGYKYLMDYFNEGDKVFIFGFSRGAFTARSLAGMIYHFGILEKGNKNLIPYVSKMYNQRKLKISSDFKRVFSKECKSHFIGVWDTVASLGYIHGKKFFDQTLNPEIRNAYHAIAIDEKRKKFSASLWDESKKNPHQTMQQVWFAGVHCNVGGYYNERGLSDIAFAWMMDKASEHGLKLKTGWQKNLQQNCLDKLHKSRVGFWRLWPKKYRSVPEDAYIHKSVFDRIKTDPKYRPKNIKDAHAKNIATNDSYISS